MEGIEKDIIEWHKQTFPNATDSAVLLKLLEECEELRSAILTGKQYAIMEELADVAIVGSVFLERRCNSLRFVMESKLDINRSRIWGKETTNGDRPRVK